MDWFKEHLKKSLVLYMNKNYAYVGYDGVGSEYKEL